MRHFRSSTVVAGAAATSVALLLALVAPAAGSSAPASGTAAQSTAASSARAAASDGPYEPTWSSVAKHDPAPTWFRDAKFGVYWHWGAFTTPEFGSEWYPRNMYAPGSGENKHHIQTYGDPATEFGYQKFIDGGTDKNGNPVQWKPTLVSKGGQFDPESWVRLIKASGAKFAGPVAEHHDGYSLWDSNVNEWNSADRGPNIDFLKLWAPLVRKNGMKFMLSMHHAYNYNGYYEHVPQQTDPSLKKLFGQLPRAEEDQLWFDKLKEVIDESHPDYIWQDFSLDKVGEDARLNFLSYYFNQAAKRAQEVVVSYKHTDPGFNDSFGVPDYERGGPADITRPYWLTDDAISASSWSYTKGIGYYSSKQMIHSMIDRVSKGGNMLLNISPTKEGTIPQEQQDVLHDIGDYLKRNGESIYSTRSWDIYGEGPNTAGGGSFTAPLTGGPTDIRFTRNKKENTLYATVLGWPGDGADLTIKTLSRDRVSLEGLKKVQLIGDRAGRYVKVKKYTQRTDGLHVTMPARPKGSEAYVLKLTFSHQIPTPHATSTGASLFEAKNLGGDGLYLPAGRYDAAQLAEGGVPSDQIRSLEVGDGNVLVAYSGDKFTGNTTEYGPGTHNVKAGSIGSIEMRVDRSAPSVVTNATNHLALDTDSSPTAGKGIAQRAVQAGDPQQVWQLVPVGDGWYQVKNPASGLVIDGIGGGQGSFAQMATPTDDDASQLWKLAEKGSQLVNIVNKETGMALDSGGNVDAGSPLKQWTVDGSPNLQWLFTPAKGGTGAP